MCLGIAMPSSIGHSTCQKEWTDDPARLKAAHVPRDVSFATKPKIARRTIARAIAAKVAFSFVAADSVCSLEVM
jgi:SRSO17 transposase